MKRMLLFTVFIFLFVLSGCKNRQEPRDTEELDLCVAQIIENDNLDGCINPRGKFSDYIEQYFVRFETDISIETTTATFDSSDNILYFYVILTLPDTNFVETYDTFETMYRNILEDLENTTDLTIWLGLRFDRGSSDHQMTFNHKDDTIIKDEIEVYIRTLSDIESEYVEYLSWLEDIATSKQFNRIEFHVNAFDHNLLTVVYPKEETYELLTEQLQSNTRLTEEDLRDSILNSLPNSFTEK